MSIKLSSGKMVGVILLSAFVLIAKMQGVHTSSCLESERTLSYVKSCPKSEDEWHQRESAFNCKQYRHTCPSFVYHCTFSEFANATLEVCAPVVSILGNRCMEYNIGGKIIQDAAGWNCSSCPFAYNSTNAYKYQECYKVKHLNITVHSHTVTCTSVIENNATHPSLKNTSRFEGICKDTLWNVFGVLSVTLNIVFITLLTIAIVYILKHRSSLPQKKRSNSVNENSDEGENIPMITYPKQVNENSDEGENIPMITYPKQENEYWVSAIDIGDTYCGMAYLNPESPKDIIPVGKVERISVLLSTNGTMLAFGDSACEMYISGNHEPPKCFYLDELKIDDEKVKIKNHIFPTIQIYRSIINYLLLKIHGEIDKAKDKNTKRRPELDIHYVLTVPNHWKRRLDKLKNAILGAKIADQKVTKEKLHVKLRETALSPFIHEVKAAVLCLNFNIDNMTLKENRTYAVLHVGSNHCSLAFPHVDDSTQPDNISCEPYLQKWEKMPEDRFLSFFKDIFTPTVIQKWMEEHHKEYISLMYQFEKQKIKMYQNTDDDEKFEFELSPVPFESRKQTFKASQKDIEDEVRKVRGMEMKNNGRTFIISWSLLKQCFEEVINETRVVVEKNKTLFEQKNVHCVMMTGRYSQMRTVLNEAEKNWFHDLPVTVAIPIVTGSTYAMGAAYFRKKFPNFVSCQDLHSNKTPPQ
ncbi:uncharacterized protein LOC125651731 isoform X2 [Ostrea edulis]|uniref:uncharacterized protein LOC125651731 isoform X2 n=1 Tax=Ostrea edulis TaxID=37623 RepID=UPI0024AF2B41|nr:uncharacterized protein LOC125651731 isoform X2 [Ostrea edulis]